MSSQGKSLSFKSQRISSSGWKVDNRETARTPDRLLLPNSCRCSCGPRCVCLWLLRCHNNSVVVRYPHHTSAPLNALMSQSSSLATSHLFPSDSRNHKECVSTYENTYSKTFQARVFPYLRN